MFISLISRLPSCAKRLNKYSRKAVFLLSEKSKNNIFFYLLKITGILNRGNEIPTPSVVGLSDSHKRQAFGSQLKESIFSGLNNLEVNTILNLKFNDKFGFTEEDVEELLKYYDLKEKRYEQELIDKGIKDIIKLAIVFKGKAVKITQ